MIAPCLCTGTSKWVHRECLDRWRGNRPKRSRFTECGQCRYKYQLHRVKAPGEMKRQIHCYLSVAIDVIVPILVIVIIVLIIGSLMAWYDPHQSVAESLYRPLGSCSRIIAHGVTAICVVASWAVLTCCISLVCREWHRLSSLSMESVSLEMMCLGIYAVNSKISTSQLVRCALYLSIFGGLILGCQILKKKIKDSLHQRREEAGLNRQTEMYVVMNRH